MLEFASGFHQNALVCLPQDLHTLYVYWDFTPQRIQTLHDFFSIVKPEMKLSLRLCRRDAPLPEQELTLPALEPGGCYFYNLDPRMEYHFELGAISPAGEFVLLARTPIARTQPGGNELSFTSVIPPAVALESGLTIPLEKEPPVSIFSWS
ncbi:hypothetical protein MGLY_02730 [Neomoorella glycerini]|uniref:DUF4912 domain-containing protein n=1 Tax=Neomoorella glycerini TaxID=55779 RepID=A0A6I5ZMV9_9FIRM|nr:DUF4912 domain-containing protein [Moorella glycerini]QGP90951.1 hypothetical protein MGLY_02730 [Moorella glycerini]